MRHDRCLKGSMSMIQFEICIPASLTYAHHHISTMSNDNNPSKMTVKMLPPPQRPLTHLTPDNPFPKENPSVFNDAMVVRRRVFVDEQKCDPQTEVDADDARSWHFVFYDDDDTATSTSTPHPPPIGVLRIIPPPHPPHTDIITSETFREPQEPYIKLGRFALLQEYRGRGLAVVLGEIGLEWARSHAQEITAALHSESMAEAKATTHTSGGGRSNGEQWRGLTLVHGQKYAEGLYSKKMGFVVDEDMGEWLENEMVHVGMWRRLDCQNN